MSLSADTRLESFDNTGVTICRRVTQSVGKIADAEIVVVSAIASSMKIAQCTQIVLLL